MEYNQKEIMDRLDGLLKERGMKAKELLSLLGMHGSAVSEWKNGKTHLSLKSAIAITQIFDVSMDWFLFGIESYMVKELSDYEADLITLFRRLSPYDQGRVVGNIEVFLTGNSGFLSDY